VRKWRGQDGESRGRGKVYAIGKGKELREGRKMGERREGNGREGRGSRKG